MSLYKEYVDLGGPLSFSEFMKFGTSKQRSRIALLKLHNKTYESTGGDPKDDVARQKYIDENFSPETVKRKGRLETEFGETFLNYNDFVEFALIKQLEQAKNTKEIWTGFQEAQETLLSDFPKRGENAYQRNIANILTGEASRLGIDTKKVLTDYLTGTKTSADLTRQYGADAAKSIQAAADDYAKMSGKSAEEIRSLGSQATGEVQKSVQNYLDTATQTTTAMKGYGQQALGAAITGAEDYRDISTRSAEASRGYGRQAVSAVEEGAADYVTGFRNLAQGGMPGYATMRGDIQQGVSGAISKIKDIGGSAGSLNAITQAIVGGQQQERQLAIQQALYKDQSRRSLAEANLTAGQARAGVLGNMAVIEQTAGQIEAQGAMGAGQAISGAYKDVAGIEQTAGQMLGESQRLAGQDVSTAMLNQASQEAIANQIGAGARLTQGQLYEQAALNRANIEQSANQMVGDATEMYTTGRESAVQTGANMFTTAANIQGTEFDKQYQTDEFIPATMKYDYYNQMINQTNPAQLYSTAYGNMGGWGSANEAAAQNERNMKTQLWGSVIGGLTQTAATLPFMIGSGGAG